MKTTTNIEHPVAELIRNRKSVRAYDARPIEDEKINSLFEAARWAPSSANEQPWMYLYATRKDQPELWQKLYECLNVGNKLWAAGAPLLVLSLTRARFEKNNMPNGFAHFDLGAANSFLALQAVEMGLQLRQMGGYSQEQARKTLNIPDDFVLGSLIAVGYPGDPETLPEPLRTRELTPRSRRAQSEFTRTEIFQS